MSKPGTPIERERNEGNTHAAAAYPPTSDPIISDAVIDFKSTRRDCHKRRYRGPFCVAEPPGSPDERYLAATRQTTPYRSHYCCSAARLRRAIPLLLHPERNFAANDASRFTCGLSSHQAELP